MAQGTISSFVACGPCRALFTSTHAAPPLRLSTTAASIHADEPLGDRVEVCLAENQSGLGIAAEHAP
jgi:hypothetical protein